ncbi:MAG: hypothetical protein ABEL51_14950 [Salinibacter sp.]
MLKFEGASGLRQDRHLTRHGHLADAPAAVGAQGGRLQVEEDERGRAEGAVGPRAHPATTIREQ